MTNETDRERINVSRKNVSNFERKKIEQNRVAQTTVKSKGPSR